MKFDGRLLKEGIFFGVGGKSKVTFFFSEYFSVDVNSTLFGIGL